MDMMKEKQRLSRLNGAAAHKPRVQSGILDCGA